MLGELFQFWRRRLQMDDVQQVGDGSQRIVDLMSDRACQPPDRCEFFCLQKSSLGKLLLGDISNHGGEGYQGSRRLHVWRELDRDFQGRAIAPAAHRLPERLPTGMQELQA